MLLVTAIVFLTIAVIAARQQRRVLQQSEEMFRSLVESAQDPMFTSDADGRYLYVNPVGAARLGKTQAEITGRLVDELFPPETATQHREQVGKALRTGDPSTTEVTIEINGGRRWFSVLVQPIRDPDGGYSRALAISHDITDLKRAEIALRENEERLRQVIRVSHIGIFDHDHLTDAIYWSPEQRQIYGWGPDEPVIGKDAPGGNRSTRDLIHALDRERTLAATRSAHESVDGIFEIEYRIVLRDESVRWVSTRAQTLYEGTGSARRRVRTIGATQDITERKRAEESLALFRHCTDRSSDAIFWNNASGGFDYVNDQACRWLGYTREELLRLKLWDIDDSFSEERWHTYWKSWENAPDDSTARTQTFHRRKDGTTFPVEALGQHIKTASGRSLHVGYVRDVTELRKAEQALRESEERLRQVAMVYSIGVFDHDHLADTTYWSAELRECLQLLPTEAAGPATFRQLIHPEDRETVEAAIECALAPDGDGRYAMQHRIVCRNGVVKWLDTRSKTFFSGESNARHPTRTVGAMVDITDRMEAQEALRVSVHEKETLLREVHHRVKNNLQIIASLLHFQAKKVRDPEDLVVFNEGRNRLRAMILVHERLYKSPGLARIEFGSYLQALVQDLWHSYAAAVSGRISVSVEADPVALPIESALPCGMIVCELLTNSIKYAFPGERKGKIGVTLTSKADGITVTVSDDGTGLPADFAPDRATTFGWQLIRSLAAQLGARLATDRGPGTQVSLHFGNVNRTQP
jgi:PAS domain S-box-containing protein